MLYDFQVRIYFYQYCFQPFKLVGIFCCFKYSTDQVKNQPSLSAFTLFKCLKTIFIKCILSETFANR